MEDKPKKIGIAMIGLLVYVAICADLVQFGVTFIPVVGEILAPIISIASGFIFFIWFRIMGIKIGLVKDPKKVAGMVISAAAEVIPVLGALPGWTIMVLITIFSVNSHISIPMVTPKVVSKKPSLGIPKVIPART